MCVEHNIPITEDLAEKLTMNKGEGDEATRVQVLEKVAESAVAQGNYHLATKKFTQAGNKVCHTQQKCPVFMFGDELNHVSSFLLCLGLESVARITVCPCVHACCCCGGSSSSKQLFTSLSRMLTLTSEGRDKKQFF